MSELERSKWELGLLLRQARQQAGLSISEAANLTMIHPQELESIEDGQVAPTKVMLSVLSMAYKVSADYIVQAATARTGIFISYRHDDEPWYARNLHTKLADKFDKERVFLDVDNIDLGVDFAAAIDEELSKCVVLIVVIGKGWLSAGDSSGTRRLDDPDDFVRLEIESGLARNIVVIPILVDGASMPRATDLPKSLRPLARRKGQEMSYARFGSDCQQLISTLERILGAQSP